MAAKLEHTTSSQHLAEFNRNLQSAQEIIIDISGSENSLKEIFIQNYIEVNDKPTNTEGYQYNFAFQNKFSIDNEQYIVKYSTSSGMENLVGVSDVRYRTAQGFIFVYSIESRESFEQFSAIYETIARAKEAETFPLFLIGLGEKNLRKVSTSEASQTAKRHSCKFLEILDQDVKTVQEILINFVKETISFYSIRENDAEEQTKLSECCIAVIGDVFTGKSSLVRTLTSNKATVKYIETTSPSTSSWKYQIKSSNENILIQLIDTPGTGSYPRQVGAQVQGLVLVYSVASQDSLKKIQELREQLFATKGVSKLPSILVGCKEDLPQRMHQVSPEESKAYQTTYGACHSSRISIFDEPDLSEAFSTLIQEVQQAQSMEIAIGDLDRRGPLSKTSRKNLNKKLKPKTVVISDGVLYVTTDGTINPKTTKLVLGEDARVELLSAEPQSKIFPFEVQNSSGHVYLSATSDEERSSWVDTIIGNISCSHIAGSFMDDVVKVLLWEILASPDLYTPEPTENEKPKPFKKLKSETQEDDKRSKLRGSIGSLIRRKSTLPKITSPSVSAKKPKEK